MNYINVNYKNKYFCCYLHASSEWKRRYNDATKT